MLRIRQSNKLELLADHLIDELIKSVRAQQHPLVEQQLATQSRGMETWLRYRFAQREGVGIATALTFSLPAALIWKLVCALTQSDPANNPYEQGIMRWHLYLLLASDNQEFWRHPETEPLKHFLAGEADIERKRFQLATWIADLFDQYLVYRPDWMLSWRDTGWHGQSPKLAEATEREPWQPLLWRALVTACSDIPDRAQLQMQAGTRLVQDSSVGPLIKDLIGEQLSIFGLSTMPPEHLRFLLALAKHINIDIYVFNPCEEYWSDIVNPGYLARLTAHELAQDVDAPKHPYYDTGHPLLGALGGTGRDFIDLLVGYDEHTILEEDFQQIEGDSLLSMLQRDILEMKEICPETPKASLQADDRSIQFASCYGAMREVEALHDWLLAKFEADPDLKPGDIVVMIPDIDKYSIYIEGVFGAAQDELQIPYSLSDYKQSWGVSVLDAIAKLMRLPLCKLTAGEVFSLLATPAIMRAFGINDQHLVRIRYLLRQSAVRWGRDQEHWQEYMGEIPETVGRIPNTWAFALERMMAGYVLGEGNEEFRGVPSLVGMDNDEAAATLNILLNFIEQTDIYRARLAGPHTGGEWANIFRGLLADFLAPDSEEEAALLAWRQSISELGNLEGKLGMHQQIDLEVVLDAFEASLDKSPNNHRFLNGKVAFCTLVPMRNIPFRVVAMLGMNERDFPRRESPLSFSLLKSFPRKGDRASRPEKLYMFLEAILAARDNLYISWSGRDPQNDNQTPPASTVSLLQDVLDNSFQWADQTDENTSGQASISDALTLNHPLQPFSNKYQPDKSPWVTYSRLWARAPQQNNETQRVDTQTIQLQPPDPERSLDLAELANFFCNPYGYLLGTRMDIWPLSKLDKPLQDSESFQLDNLQRYLLRTGALEKLQTNSAPETWLKQQALSGELPIGTAGKALLDEIEQFMNAYRERVQPLLEQPPVTLPVSLKEVKLAGKIDYCRPDCRLVLIASEVNAKDFMRLWIWHLAMAASQQGRTSLLADKKHLWYLPPMAAEQAHECLETLLAVRLEYLCTAPPLTVASSFAWAQEFQKEESHLTALGKAREAWSSSTWRSGESDNWAATRIHPEFPGDDPKQREAFARIAAKVWLPLVNALQRCREIQEILSGIIPASKAGSHD